MVLTKDSDFLDLVSRHEPPPQVLRLTCGNTSNAYLQELLMELLPRALDLLRNGEPVVEIGGRLR